MAIPEHWTLELDESGFSWDLPELLNCGPHGGVTSFVHSFADTNREEAYTLIAPPVSAIGTEGLDLFRAPVGTNACFWRTDKDTGIASVPARNKALVRQYKVFWHDSYSFCPSEWHAHNNGVGPFNLTPTTKKGEVKGYSISSGSGASTVLADAALITDADADFLTTFSPVGPSSNYFIRDGRHDDKYLQHQVGFNLVPDFAEYNADVQWQKQFVTAAHTFSLYTRSLEKGQVAISPVPVSTAGTYLCLDLNLTIATYYVANAICMDARWRNLLVEVVAFAPDIYQDFDLWYSDTMMDENVNVLGNHLNTTFYNPTSSRFGHVWRQSPVFLRGNSWNNLRGQVNNLSSVNKPSFWLDDPSGGGAGCPDAEFRVTPISYRSAQPIRCSDIRAGNPITVELGSDLPPLVSANLNWKAADSILLTPTV